MPDDAITAPLIERFVPAPKALKAKRPPLKDGMPRRFRDHRSRPAQRLRQLYDQIVEAHPPRHRLGRWLAAMTADLLLDYEGLRRNKRKGARSARRKTVGLIMGSLRECRNAS